MSAITDVARLAGVSKSTASRAMSGRGYVSPETRERVRQAAARIGYVVSSNASSLVTGRSRNVGVVIPSVNRWYFAEVLEGIQSALLAAGYDLTLYRLNDDETERQRIFGYFLVRKRVDAVIAVGVDLSTQEVALLRALDRPIIGIGDIEGVSTLSIDDVAAARFITDHLISLGHTRFVYLGGDDDHRTDSGVHTRRLEGFRMALDAEGIPHADDSRSVPFSIDGGFHGALAVLSDRRSRPTAIVAGCDEVAIGVIIAARQLGIQVPAQLSVVGIDGHPLADMFQLTTLEQHPGVQGDRAVALVLARVADDDMAEAPERSVLPVTFTVRASSTAPAPVTALAP